MDNQTSKSKNQSVLSKLAYEVACEQAERDGYHPFEITKNAKGMDVEMWELYVRVF